MERRVTLEPGRVNEYPVGTWLRIERRTVRPSDEVDGWYDVTLVIEPSGMPLDEAWAEAQQAAHPEAVIRAGRTGMTATGWATAYLHGEHLETVFAATLHDALQELARRLYERPA